MWRSYCAQRREWFIANIWPETIFRPCSLNPAFTTSWWCEPSWLMWLSCYTGTHWIAITWLCIPALSSIKHDLSFIFKTSVKTGGAEAHKRAAPLQGTISLTRAQVFGPRAAISDIQLKKTFFSYNAREQGTCTEEKRNERQWPDQMQPLWKNESPCQDCNCFILCL